MLRVPCSRDEAARVCQAERHSEAHAVRRRDSTTIRHFFPRISGPAIPVLTPALQRTCRRDPIFQARFTQRWIIAAPQYCTSALEFGRGADFPTTATNLYRVCAVV